MADTSKTTPFILRILFWIIMAAIGLGAIIAGTVLIILDGNNLFWLPLALGIILFAIGLTLTVYLVVIEQKRKHIRSRGI